MPTFYHPPYAGPMLGLDPETGLITPEPYDITSELEAIRVVRRRAALVMKEELPLRKPLRFIRPEGRDVTSDEPAQYHVDEEEPDPLDGPSDGQDIIAWLHGKIGSPTRTLYIQEQRKVGDKVLWVGKPALKAVTFNRGEEPTDLSYERMRPPRYYEEHFSLAQQSEAVTRVMNVLALLRQARLAKEAQK